MQNYLTRTQAEELKKSVAKKPSYYFGEIHPYTFGEWDDTYSKNNLINIMITHIGKYELDRKTFDTVVCPVCGKKEVQVYDCFASVLSGAHVLRGICTNCGEFIAFEDREFYLKVKNYIRSNMKGNVSRLV